MKHTREGCVLLVEDERLLALPVCDLLATNGYRVICAASLAEARERFDHDHPDLVLLDLGLPDGSGFELLKEWKKPPLGPTVIVLTADQGRETVIRALRSGAYDYLTKPFDLTALLHRVGLATDHHARQTSDLLRHRLDRLKQQAGPRMETASPAMDLLYQEAKRAAAHELPVLVVGETGVGKEHVCRLLHDASPRHEAPFVAVNCGELDRRLLRSELFGHERGAFTGAGERHRGLFELARAGTLMLDEVAEMPLEVQAAFLRVLETGRFRRVGGTREIEARVRIIAATNKNLREIAREGRFREDLLYRLNALELRVPPLRERVEDIEPLAVLFCRRIAKTRGLELELSSDACRALKAYHWPGNVRELRNVIERTAVIRGPGRITAQDLALGPIESRHVPQSAASEAGPTHRNDPSYTLSVPFPSLAWVERRHIRDALEYTDGNRSRAAALLGIARSTLIRKLARIENTPAPSISPRRRPLSQGK